MIFVKLYRHSLPHDTVCLLPTRALCEEINNKLLELLSGDVVVLNAKDVIEGGNSFDKQKAYKKINQYEDDNSRTGRK